MYERPRLERFGEFRELTQFNWCHWFPSFPGCGGSSTPDPGGDPGGDTPSTS